MKIKKDLIINKIDNEYYLIDVGAKPVLNGIIKLNNTSKEIIELLQKGKNINEIVKTLSNKYNISDKTIRKDVTNIINQLTKVNLIDL